MDKVWYDCHQLRRSMIESGRIELVERSVWDYLNK